MKMITSQEDYESATKYNDEISFQCEHCKKIFGIRKQYVKYSKKIGRLINFCSHRCSCESRKKGKYYSCLQCKKITYRQLSHFLDKRVKNNNVFCSQSCAATYNNTHRTKGYRRSKLEMYLETRLPTIFPNLSFLFNDKKIINSELDVYIPSLKLAFELNGIFHYEPIYGQGKLDQIKNNDNRKFQACLERGIELCIIDTSKLSYFKEKNAKPYLDIIVNIINSKLVLEVGGASHNERL